MLCFKNGSLPRQEIRNRICNGSWDRFNEMLLTTPAGNNGKLAIYFQEMEILPHAQGVYMRDIDGEVVESLAPEEEVRAVIEGQFLAKRLHAQSFGFTSGKFS